MWPVPQQLDLHMLMIRASALRGTNKKCLKALLLECEKENNSVHVKLWKSLSDVCTIARREV
jgi:hypothetical protein